MISIYNAVQLHIYKKHMKEILNNCRNNPNTDTIAKMTDMTDDCDKRYITGRKAGFITEIIILIAALLTKLLSNTPDSINLFAEIMMYWLLADSIFGMLISAKYSAALVVYRHMIKKFTERE